MKMRRVDSSNIDSVGYHASRRLLTVKFKRKEGVSTYHYADVNLRTFEGLLFAESPGRYFNEHIRGLPFTKADD